MFVLTGMSVLNKSRKSKGFLSPGIMKTVRKNGVSELTVFDFISRPGEYLETSLTSKENMHNITESVLNISLLENFAV